MGKQAVVGLLDGTVMGETVGLLVGLPVGEMVGPSVGELVLQPSEFNSTTSMSIEKMIIT
jgi:hypothetical protein